KGFHEGIFSILACVFSACVIAQDERFVREMLSGDLSGTPISDKKEKVHFHAISPFYEIDLDGDDRVEYIVIEKVDSKDWLHIHSYNKERIFSMQFVPKGFESDVYRINLRQISDKTKVLLISYYEGYNQAENFLSSARLYLASWDNNDLKTISHHRGPMIWEEFANTKKHYHQRPYE